MRALPGALTVIALILLGTTFHFIQEKGNTRHAAAEDRRVADKTQLRAELASTRASSAERAATAAEARRKSAEQQRAQAVTAREAALQEARDATQRAERAEAARRAAEIAGKALQEVNLSLRGGSEKLRGEIATFEKMLAVSNAARQVLAEDCTALDRRVQSAVIAGSQLEKDLNVARLSEEVFERRFIESQNTAQALEIELARSEKARRLLEDERGNLRRQRDAQDRRLRSALTAGQEVTEKLDIALVRQDRAERLNASAAEKAAALGHRLAQSAESLVLSEERRDRLSRERGDLDRRLQTALSTQEQTRRQLNVALLRRERAERLRLQAKDATSKAGKAARSAEEALKISREQARQSEEDRESMSIQVLEIRAALKKAQADRDAALREARKGQVMLEKEQQHRSKLKTAFESEGAERKKALKAIDALKKEVERISKERAAALKAAEGVEKARRAAEAQARELTAARATGLREIQRLADHRRCQKLAEGSEKLWPAIPERVPAMERWLEEARDLQGRGAEHRKALEKLRATALPYSEKAKARDRTLEEARDPEAARELRSMDAAIETAKAAKDTKTVKDLRARASSLAKSLNRRSTWEFSDAATAWRHDVLVDLQRELRELRASIEKVQQRHQQARSLARRSIDEQRKAWTSTIAEIADPQRSPQYRGLKLKPQLGLVPLGADPASGLQEFAHIPSGDVPRRDPESGSLALTPESALVLALLPGGSFAMGASNSEKEGQPNYDPHATPDEGPVHQVKLAPFFVSKYEMTQSQWARIAGRNPSYFRPTMSNEDFPISPLHPVEQVSWRDCVEVLNRLGLALPTEAQWEYACRGSTTSTFAAGAALAALRGFANIADEGSKALYSPSWTCEAGFRDGFAIHAPVGNYRPNAFGLHDVHGNVAEWCRDHLAGYDVAPSGDDALRDGSGDPHLRIFRGGSYAYPSSEARAAARRAQSPDFRHSDTGVRPVRPVH